MLTLAGIELDDSKHLLQAAEPEADLNVPAGQAVHNSALGLLAESAVMMLWQSSFAAHVHGHTRHPPLITLAP